MADENENEIDDAPLIEYLLPRTKTIKWSAWTGSHDDLSKVAAVFTEAAEKRRKDELEFVGATPDEVNEKWGVKAEAPHRPEKMKAGPADKVIKAIDPRTIQSLKLTAGSERYGRQAQMTLTMSARIGVELTLMGIDSGWLAQAEESLSHEIKLCVPWWSFMRRYWVKWIYIWFLVEVGSFIGGAAKSSSDGWWPNVIGGAIGLAVALGTGIPLLRFLPPFEVVPLGASSKSRRTLAIAGTLLLNVVVVAVGIIYAASQSKK